MSSKQLGNFNFYVESRARVFTASSFRFIHYKTRRDLGFYLRRTRRCCTGILCFIYVLTDDTRTLAMSQNGILDKVRNVLISTKIRVWDKNLKLKFSKRKSEHRVPVRGRARCGELVILLPFYGSGMCTHRMRCK